jgi:protoheme IX farnesyltransferase
MPPEKTAPFGESHHLESVLSFRKASLSAYWELTKPRLSMMAVTSALLGYLAAGYTDIVSFLSVFFGTAFAAGGAAALNMWWEREEDAMMHRTADRPLPQGELSPQATLSFGIVLSVVGPAVLWVGSNALAGVLTAVTILTYVLIYTPLKKVTSWSTEIGALPGALPPLIGWVAAANSVGWMGLFLFAVLYAWQMPHFMAISWLYREDYRKGGFRMLSVEDPTGKRVSRRAIIWAAPLLALTIMDWSIGECGWLFLVGGSALSLVYLKAALAMHADSERSKPARRLFITSIIFLPSYLILMVVDRILFSL